MKKKYIVTGAVTLAMTSIIGIYAFYSSRDSIKNKFGVGIVDIEVSEEFEIPQDWNGSVHKKDVKIENKSTVDAFMRVAIIPRWVDEGGLDWPGDTSIIKINYTNIVDINDEEIGWIDGCDGYFYYKKKMLPTGEDENKFTKELIKSVEADIPESLKTRYSGKKLIVEVKSEAVQAFGDAYEVSWTTANDEIKSMLQKLSK